MEIFGAVLDSPRAIWAACGVICALNCVLMCMRPEMAMDFGFKKWNQCWMSGLPTDSPLLCFGTVKNNPGLYDLDQKSSMCCGLNYVEIVFSSSELNLMLLVKIE